MDISISVNLLIGKLCLLFYELTNFKNIIVTCFLVPLSIKNSSEYSVSGISSHIPTDFIERFLYSEIFASSSVSISFSILFPVHNFPEQPEVRTFLVDRNIRSPKPLTQNS